jgi:hypothetical protein
MKSILIKKTSFVFFFILLILFYISLCVANKPDNLDNDYYVYFNAFNTNESKEITYYIVTQVCKYFGLAFSYLLFFYCFVSLVIKYKLFVDVVYSNIFKIYLRKNLYIFKQDVFRKKILLHDFCFNNPTPRLP